MKIAAHLTHNTPVLVAGLLLVDSLHFVFARLLLPHLPPVTSAMFVLTIASLEIFVFAAIQGRLQFSSFQKNGGFFLVVGFLVAASTYLNYAAVAFIDPGTASLLGKASVLFGLGFGLLWLGDRLTTRQSVGAILAVVGIATITFHPGDYLRLGSFMVLASTLMYALHAALVKRYADNLNFIDFFLFRLLSTTGFLFVFAAGTGKLVWPDGHAWLLLALVGTVDVVISRAFYYLSLRRLSMSLHTLILTLSPVVAVSWSIFLFNAIPTTQQLIGGAAVLLGVLLVTTQRSKT